MTRYTVTVKVGLSVSILDLIFTLRHHFVATSHHISWRQYSNQRLFECGYHVTQVVPMLTSSSSVADDLATASNLRPRSAPSLAMLRLLQPSYRVAPVPALGAVAKGHGHQRQAWPVHGLCRLGRHVQGRQ